MAKISSIEKNKKRIALELKNREIRAKLKKIVLGSKYSLKEKLAAQAKLDSLEKNSSPVRIVNRCYQTGRARGYIGFFGLGRMAFRELALKGLLPGVKKSSW